MTIQQEVDFQRIARPYISYRKTLVSTYIGQIASHVYMSEAHFQRMFTGMGRYKPQEILTVRKYKLCKIIA